MPTDRVLKCRRLQINRAMGVRVASDVAISPTAATGEIRKRVNAQHRAMFPTQAILLRRRALSNQQLRRPRNRQQSRDRSHLTLNRGLTQ